MAFVAELILVLVTLHAGLGQALLEKLMIGLGMVLVHAVADDLVTFGVRPGETYGLLGPNGAGKTTTMRMITGFLEPSSGRVTVDGIDAAKKPREARARIGYLPETLALYPEMRVHEYLAYRARLEGVRMGEDYIPPSLEGSMMFPAFDGGAVHLHRQHAGRVGQLFGKIHLEVADDLPAPFAPALQIGRAHV